MARFDKDDLSAILQDDQTLRSVEDSIYSVLPNDEDGNEYDSQFRFFYDLVACNPIYNRLIWGYSISVFHKMAEEALYSSSVGYVLYTTS